VSVEDLLRTLPHFDTLARDEIDALSSALDVRDYPDGHVFVREGDRGDTIFLLVEGNVQVSRDRHGARQELNRMKPGDLFGLVALVDDSPRSATCRAVGKVKVGALPKSVVSILFHQRAPIAYAFQLALATQLARDFRQLDARVRDRMRAGK